MHAENILRLESRVLHFSEIAQEIPIEPFCFLLVFFKTELLFNKKESWQGPHCLSDKDTRTQVQLDELGSLVIALRENAPPGAPHGESQEKESARYSIYLTFGFFGQGLRKQGFALE